MIPVIRLKNLPKSASRDELRAALSVFGNILEAKVEVNSVTDVSLGTGSVRFETQDSANRAAAAKKVSIRGQEVEMEAVS